MFIYQVSQSRTSGSGTDLFFRLIESVLMIWERLMNVSELDGLLKSSM